MAQKTKFELKNMFG